MVATTAVNTTQEKQRHASKIEYWRTMVTDVSQTKKGAKLTMYFTESGAHTGERFKNKTGLNVTFLKEGGKKHQEISAAMGGDIKSAIARASFSLNGDFKRDNTHRVTRLDSAGIFQLGEIMNTLLVYPEDRTAISRLVEPPLENLENTL